MSSRNYISLEITYPFEYYPRLDKKISNLIAGTIDASGTDGDSRELAFKFFDEKTAIAAGELLRRVKSKIRLIYVQKWDGDKWHDIKTIKRCIHD